MAIGATRERVLASVLGAGLRLTRGGVAVGIALALALLGARLLSSFLFRVGPADPLTLGAVSLLLLGVAALALALPARQAVRVDPAESTRGQQSLSRHPAPCRAGRAPAGWHDRARTRTAGRSRSAPNA